MTGRGGKPASTRRARVLRIDARALPDAIEADARYQELLLLVWAGPDFLGRLWVAAARTVPRHLLEELIRDRFGARQWELSLRARVQAAASPGSPTFGAAPDVSVVVCTRDRPADLRTCLEALGQLDPAPREIVVVDSAPTGPGARELCAELGARYVREPLPGASRARNRGLAEAKTSLIAFLDDDCIATPGWLAGVEASFDDPLVAAVTGYVAPVELETRAQYLFELHSGFDRGAARKVFDGRSVSPVLAAPAVGVSANVVIRRSALAAVGPFAEDLGPGTTVGAGEETELFYRLLAHGLRIEHDPTRVVWHRHRADARALRRVLEAYSTAVTAYGLRCLIRHREPAGLAVLWWWARRIAGDARRSVMRVEDALPLGHVLMEVVGMLAAPGRLLRAKRACRGRAAIVPPGEPAGSAISIVAEPPRLSVVVPSHNRRERLSEILDALAAGTYPADRFEVVVALDRCTDGSRDLASRGLPYPLTIVESDHGSAGPTRRDGATAASAATLVFLDDDIVPDPAFLAAHAAAQRTAVDTAVLGYCPPAVAGATWWEQDLRNWWEDHYRRQGDPRHHWTFVDFAVGNASIPRSVLEGCGGFDPTFPGPRGREDWELGIRLLRHGAAFRFERAARGLHHLDASFETAVRNRRAEARSEVAIARRHPGVVAQLPLVKVADALARGERRVALAFRHPEAAARGAAVSTRMLPMLEQLRLRRRWSYATGAVIRHSFVAGIVDELPSEDELLAFVGAAAWRESVVNVDVGLDERGEPLPAAGSVDLVVHSSGRRISAVVPADPGEQWDWDEIVTRVARHGHLVQRAEVERQLRELAGLGAGT